MAGAGNIKGSVGNEALVVVRGALGDVLLTLPFLAALPEALGSKGLGLVGARGPLSLLETLPFVHRTYDQDRADWSGIYADPPAPSPWLAGELGRYSRAVVFSRSDPDPAATGLAALGLTPVWTVPSAPPEGLAVHAADYMFQKTGLPRPTRPVRLVAPEKGRAEAASRLAALGLGPGEYAVIHPGSGGSKKNRPLEDWLETAAQVRLENSLVPVFLIGPAEAGQAAALESLPADVRPVVVKGLSLEGAAGLIESAALFLGHDSGPSHLSAALGRPTIAYFGQTDPDVWSPNGPHVEIRRF